jgi:hypothetical protein
MTICSFAFSTDSITQTCFLHGHAFFRLMNMRDEYLIHKTHRTFRAWLLPFSFVGGQP